MALVEIEYGALASSEVMNNNFNYLENKISTDTENLASKLSIINNALDDLQTNITDFSNKFKFLETQVNNDFTNSGLYITTFKNGSSWYREFFSDKEKKNRVWIEQGYKVSGNMTVLFLKPFSNPDYTVVISNQYTSGQTVNPTYNNLTTSSVYINTDGKPACVYCCGI